MIRVEHLKAITLILLLQGCASGALQEQKILFSGDKGEFTAVKSGCDIRGGQFKDKSGMGNPFPYFKFIAVSNDGRTLSEWNVSCKAVSPNGTSDCDILGDGDNNAFESGGGIGCPAFTKFKLVM